MVRQLHPALISLASVEDFGILPVLVEQVGVEVAVLRVITVVLRLVDVAAV